jgi:hypothetical protein
MAAITVIRTIAQVVHGIETRAPGASTNQEPLMLLSYLVATTAFAKGVAIGSAGTWLVMRNGRNKNA